MGISILSSHGTLRECLWLPVADLGRFEVEQHSCVTEANRYLQARRPSLLIADVGYPVPRLLDLLKMRRRGGPQAWTILVGIDPLDDPASMDFLEQEIHGILPIDAGVEDMLDAIERVVEGEQVYHPSVAFLLYQRLAMRSREQTLRDRLEVLTLTRRELEVLSLVADRSSNEAIASRLGISIHTVKNHVHNILEKLGVESRSAAAELAFQRGWLKAKSLGKEG